MLSLNTRTATAADLGAITRLLADSDLPTVGVDHALATFLVVEAGHEVVATAGVERYGEAVLLRSVVVRPLLRGSGVAQSLVSQLLDRARDQGATAAYLLTTTAEGYFARLGFTTIARGEVPATVQASIEFREACPASATVMRRPLKGPG